jgi:hypothetical protein
VSFNEQTGTNTINFTHLTQNGSQVSGQIAFYGPDGGVWSNAMLAVLGSGRWTFNISETSTDANGGSVTGSVSVTGGTNSKRDFHRADLFPVTNDSLQDAHSTHPANRTISPGRATSSPQFTPIKSTFPRDGTAASSVES